MPLFNLSQVTQSAKKIGTILICSSSLKMKRKMERSLIFPKKREKWLFGASLINHQAQCSRTKLEGLTLAVKM